MWLPKSGLESAKRFLLIKHNIVHIMVKVACHSFLSFKYSHIVYIVCALWKEVGHEIIFHRVIGK